ncbi:hypothetical protein J6590_077879 [Homalodisca vitripennis]|nr:hypothetical protein J6590_077879 [Homalodisca vitripennis]
MSIPTKNLLFLRPVYPRRNRGGDIELMLVLQVVGVTSAILLTVIVFAKINFQAAFDASITFPSASSCNFRYLGSPGKQRRTGLARGAVDSVTVMKAYFLIKTGSSFLLLNCCRLYFGRPSLHQLLLTTTEIIDAKRKHSQWASAENDQC